MYKQINTSVQSDINQEDTQGRSLQGFLVSGLFAGQFMSRTTRREPRRLVTHTTSLICSPKSQLEEH